MDHDPWLINEVRRLTSDLHGMQTSVELVPRKFELGYADVDAIVIIGRCEWNTLAERIDDARLEIIQQLNAFIENEYQRQLHWSALRMLTASGVLASELSAFHGRLKFITERPDGDMRELGRLVAWFEGQLLPVSHRLSNRLMQMIARLLDPHEWQVSGGISMGSGQNLSPMSLSMAFQPKTEERWRKQRAEERRLSRIEMD